MSSNNDGETQAAKLGGGAASGSGGSVAGAAHAVGDGAAPAEGKAAGPGLSAASLASVNVAPRAVTVEVSPWMWGDSRSDDLKMLRRLMAAGNPDLTEEQKARLDDHLQIWVEMGASGRLTGEVRERQLQAAILSGTSLGLIPLAARMVAPGTTKAESRVAGAVVGGGLLVFGSIWLSDAAVREYRHFRKPDLDQGRRSHWLQWLIGAAATAGGALLAFHRE